MGFHHYHRQHQLRKKFAIMNIKKKGIIKIEQNLMPSEKNLMPQFRPTQVKRSKGKGQDTIINIIILAVTNSRITQHNRTATLKSTDTTAKTTRGKTGFLPKNDSEGFRLSFDFI